MFWAKCRPIFDPAINGLPRSGPNNGPYEIRPVKSLPRSGPNYGPDRVRPFKRLWAKLWPISDSARQLDAMLLGPLLKAHLVIWPDISFGLLRARLTFWPYINFGLLKARHIVGPNYGSVCIRPARS